MRLLVLFAALPLSAAITGFSTKGQPTAQQAILQWSQTYAGTCTVEVSESPTYSPVVNSVNAALFTNANVTTAGAGGQEFIVGYRDAPTALTGKLESRSLAAGTAHYARLTCDGETATLTFTTAPLAGITPEAPPWNSDGHGNVAFPDFDFTDITKPVIDPQTGARVYRVTDPTDHGFTQAATFVANTVQGGSGWSGLQDLASGNTAPLATTTNTNWAFIPLDADTSRTFGGFQVAEQAYLYQQANVGINLYGSVTDTSGENGKAQLCLSVDGGANCYTAVIDSTAFTGSATNRGVFPSTYASAGYIGWSKPIPANYRMKIGYVTASASSTVTLVNSRNRDNNPASLTGIDAAAAWFQPEWAAGTKIYIAGTSPTCTNNLCTLVSVTDRDTIVIAETITVTQALYKSYGFGVMVRKKTATGSLSISASHVDLGYKALQQGQQVSCSTLEVSTVKSKTGSALGYTQYGYLCLPNVIRDANTHLYFIGTRPYYDVRILSLIPRSGLIAGYPTADQPELEPGYMVGPTTSGLAFSTTDANSFYLLMNTRTPATPALWKLTYDASLEYVEPANIHNSFSVGGQISGYTDPLTWVNLTRPSLGQGLIDQITANTTYNATLWGSLDVIKYAGLINGYQWFYRSVNNGQNTPAAFFLFTEDGTFSTWFDTMTNGQPGARFAALHSNLPYGTVSTWNAVAASPSVLFGGPFVAKPACVFKSGVCDPDTSLPGIIGGSMPAYDSTCPVDLPASVVALGGAPGSNQCVTLEIQGEPCSATPTAAEKAAYPCPGDANKSTIGSSIAALDAMQDAVSAATGDADEMLVIGKRTDLGAGRSRLVLLRDAANGYGCSVSNQAAYPALRPGRNCAANDTQAAHEDQWSFYMVPRGTYQALNVATNTWSFENQWMTVGHQDRSYVQSTTQSFGGVCCYIPQGYAARNGGSIGDIASAYFAQWPLFAGIAANDGGVSSSFQSYLATAALNASVGIPRASGGDWRHVNDQDGCEPECVGDNVGITHTFALEGGTTSVYRICGAVDCATNPNPITGTYEPRKNQLVMWAGLYLLLERSGISVTLTDADLFKFCYVLIAGECRPGSTVGSVYAVIPNLQTDVAQCNASQISYRAACLFATTTVLANAMQVRFENDPEGIYQRKMGQNLTRPGAQYAYSHVRAFGDGTKYLGSVYQNGGWYSGVVMIDPGPMVQDSTNRTAFQGVGVQFNATSWYVRFGYSPSLECAPRSGPCVADSTTTVATGPKLDGQTASAVSGSGTVIMPAKPGTVLYRAIVANGVQGATTKITVQ